MALRALLQVREPVSLPSPVGPCNWWRPPTGGPGLAFGSVSPVAGVAIGEAGCLTGEGLVHGGEAGSGSGERRRGERDQGPRERLGLLKKGAPAGSGGE